MAAGCCDRILSLNVYQYHEIVFTDTVFCFYIFHILIYRNITMLYASRIKLIGLCLCTGMATGHCCITKKSNTHTNERKMIMNDQITEKSTWLTQIKEMLLKQSSGRLVAKDVSGTPVVLEWKMTDILSSDLATFKKDVSDIAAQTTAAVEVQFLRDHPEAASSEYLLMPASRFSKTDWRRLTGNRLNKQYNSRLNHFI